VFAGYNPALGDFNPWIEDAIPLTACSLLSQLASGKHVLSIFGSYPVVKYANVA
jgi:hypothetical protein